MPQYNKNDKTASQTSPKSGMGADVKKDETIAQKVGDVVERVGEKLKDMGAEKLGSAVYSAGNKLEHSDKSGKH